MNKRKKVGLAGCFLLAVGVFMPIVSLPIVGNVNYFRGGTGDGVLVLILALVSALLLWKEKYKGLWVTAIASLLIMTVGFLDVINLTNTMRAEAVGNPFAGLIAESVQMGWGWFILVAGASALIVSAATKGVSDRGVVDAR